MHFLSSFIFALSSNMDCFVIGLSYGIRKISIGWLFNLIIGFISLTGTILSMFFGKSIRFLLPENLAEILGGLIIILIGIVGMLRYWINRYKIEGSELDGSAELKLWEVLFLGVSLTVNNVGLGIGASITGLQVLPTACCSFFVSLLFLSLGNRIGRSQLARSIGKHAEPLANLFMVGLGIYEMFV
ncbi:manganese efflux pump [Clostridium sp. AM58-1XD]|uniref:manganese efflux pump MntP n=1 Tax=Clostridium sp. AM58-1XD TaxID=2292307 RepID=UPI000E46A8E9|nr:manganese efflux pump [Clostridium sp. AM58-1XD]RGY97949.1 hypothetical protein DXA13_12885 [Clostridium sp. AM58-1XD]